jgi:hypothetical protein
VERSHDASAQRGSLYATVYRSLSPALELGGNAKRQSEFGNVNRFLIEKPAAGRHVRAHPEAATARGLCWATVQ